MEPHEVDAYLDSLAPHVAQHETVLEQLVARLDDLEAQLAAQAAKVAAAPEVPTNGADTVPDRKEPVKQPPDRDFLQAEGDRTRRSIATHQMLIALGRDVRVGVVLAQVAADRELARLAAADPAGFAAERGIPVPENMILDMLVDDQTMSLRITYINEDAPFVLIWTPEGFRPPPTELSEALDAAG